MPSVIPKAMTSLVEQLRFELAGIQKFDAGMDPFMLAAKYRDGFVNIHPLRDGNGHMCRMIMNAILLKFAGIVVTLGERDDEREEYLFIATESGKAGGHPGQLRKLVLEAAGGSFRRLRSALTRQMKASIFYRWRTITFPRQSGLCSLMRIIMSLYRQFRDRRIFYRRFFAV